MAMTRWRPYAGGATLMLLGLLGLAHSLELIALPAPWLSPQGLAAIAWGGFVVLLLAAGLALALAWQRQQRQFWALASCLSAWVDWDLRRQSGVLYVSSMVTASPPETGSRISLAAWLSRIHPDDRAALSRALQPSPQDLSAGLDTPWRHQVRLWLNEQWHWHAVTLQWRQPDRHGRPQRAWMLLADATEQRRQRERLERQLLFDDLTQLPNRAQLTQLLGEAMTRAELDGHLLALCFIDIDHFKTVNERHGYRVGNRLLQEMARRLQATLRVRASGSDAVARLGGDEFVLLLRAHTVDEARAAIERVRRELALPYAVAAHNQPVSVFTSIGATWYPLDRSDADTLLRHAENALYSVKQTGRDGYWLFDAEFRRQAEQRVMAIGRVQDALDHGELELYYQPKVDLQRATLLGLEALLR